MAAVVEDLQVIRRGFLARLAGVLAAPFVARPALDWIPDDAVHFRGVEIVPDIIIPGRHGKSFAALWRLQEDLMNQMPRCNARITDLKDVDLGD